MFGANYCGKVYPAQSYYPVNRQYIQALSVVVNVTASFIKGVGKGLANTVQVALSPLKGVGKGLVASNTVTVYDQNGVGTLKQVATTVNSALSKRVGKNLALAVTAALFVQFTVYYLLNVGVTVTVNLSTGLKIVLMVVVATVTLTMQKQVGKSLGLAINAVVSIMKGLLQALAATTQVFIARTLQAGKGLSVQGTVSLSGQHDINALRAVAVSLGSGFGKQATHTLQAVVRVYLSILARVSGIPLISGLVSIGDRLFHRVRSGDHGDE